VFYGWTVVATVFLVLMVAAGLGFYNASVILNAAVDELDAEVGAVSGAVGLFFGVSGLTGFALARFMDRVDLRWFYASGGVVGSTALYGLHWVDSVPKLYVFFAVFGIAFSLCGLVPGTTLVARWFDRRRAMALSIASTGLSMGGIAVTPIAERLIRNNGLAESGRMMSLIWFLGVVPAAVLLIRSKPSEKGLEPDGAPKPPSPLALRGATFTQAVGTRFFRWLCLTYAMIFLAQVGAIAQLFNLISERVDKDTAAFAMSALALTSVVGRLVGGVLVLKIGSRTMTIVLTLFQGMALALIALAGTGPALVAATIFFGVSIGNLLMLQPLLLAEAFGVKEYSRIYSFNQLFSTVGVASGPLALGLIHDAFDYRTAFFLAAGANVIGFVALLLAGNTAKPLAIWSSA
jgi:MFS family permease